MFVSRPTATVRLFVFWPRQTSCLKIASAENRTDSAGNPCFFFPARRLGRSTRTRNVLTSNLFFVTCVGLLFGVCFTSLAAIAWRLCFFASAFQNSEGIDHRCHSCVRCVVAVRCVFPFQIFVGGLDQEVNDADFRAYFAK